jgi:YD repeat-containing protein
VNQSKFQGRERRRALISSRRSSSLLGLWLRWVAVLACLAAVPVEAVAAPGLGGVPAPTGPARRWEAGLPVGPFSQVNLRTGRVWTEIPIVGWGGKGPAISFSLYHNMSSTWGPPMLGAGALLGDANGDGDLSTADMDPFVDILLEGAPTQSELAVADFNANQTVDTGDLTAMTNALLSQPTDAVWTHSYSTSLEIGEGTVTVIWGDGTKDTYLDDGNGGFTPPPGVFSTLQTGQFRNNFGGLEAGYILTTKTQTRFLFKLNGRLEAIQDATGIPTDSSSLVNRVKLFYDGNNNLTQIADAADRQLLLRYNGDGRLSEIDAPLDARRRLWRLLYLDPSSGNPDVNGTGPFVALDDPILSALGAPGTILPDHRVNIDYNSSFDISNITDWADHAYAFTYQAMNGRLLTGDRSGLADSAGRIPGPVHRRPANHLYGRPRRGVEVRVRQPRQPDQGHKPPGPGADAGLHGGRRRADPRGHRPDQRPGQHLDVRL